MLNRIIHKVKVVNEEARLEERDFIAYINTDYISSIDTNDEFIYINMSNNQQYKCDKKELENILIESL